MRKIPDCNRSRSLRRQLFFEPLEQRHLFAADPFMGPDPSLAAPTSRLFAGIADASSSPTNAGLLTIIDRASGAAVPWSNVVDGHGIHGLAFRQDSRLYAAVDQGPCTISDLIEIDPRHGNELRRVVITAGATPISIGDLAVHPATGEVYGIRSDHDDAGRAGELYVINVDSGAATLIGDTRTRSGDSLAFASDGSLYLGGVKSAQPVLYRIDPDTAQPHELDLAGDAAPDVTVTDLSGNLKAISGLAGHPTNGTLVATASKNHFSGLQIVDDIYVIDPATGNVTVEPLGAPARGIFGDLDFQPSGPALDLLFAEDFENGPGGFVPDNRTGGTLPGLWHLSPGRRFDGLPNHTPTTSWYYGAFESAFGGGHFVLTLDHQGTLASPTITLPTASVLSFNYLLDVRDQPDVDLVTVSVRSADGTITPLLSRTDGTLPQTGQQWRTAAADLSAMACQPVQILFSFDTGDVPQIDPEGWYLDDVMIGSLGGECDFGDAPDPTYPTLLASDGARHGVVSGFHLGPAIDIDPDGQPTLMADGDDTDADGDDEDGVAILSLDPARADAVLFTGQQGTATVELTNTVGMGAFLDAWIDFNRNGNWLDEGEQILLSAPLVPGSNTVTWLVPAAAAAGETMARFRLSSTGGLSPSGPADDGEVEDDKVLVEPWNPKIELIKSGRWEDTNQNGRPDEDDFIRYTFQATNTGNVTLLDVSITDPMVTIDPPIGLIGADQDGLADDLLPGGILTATGSYRLTQTDVDARMKSNTAVVLAKAPNGDAVQDDDSVMVLLPSVKLVKTNVNPNSWNDSNGNGRPDVGEIIDYQFEITNDGKLILFDVTLEDSTAEVGPLSGEFTSEDGDSVANDLLPGKTANATGQYTLIQADIDSAQKMNTATVRATDPDGNPIRDEDKITTPLPDPRIRVVKSNVSPGGWDDSNGNSRADAGETISYQFQIINEGNVPLCNVTLVDSMVAVGSISGLTDACPGGLTNDLARGATATAMGTYTLTQVDLDAGQKVNTATVSATDPSGKPIGDDDAVTTPLEPVPRIRITKSNVSPGGWNDSTVNGRPDAGESIRYEFKIANEGNVSLCGVSLADSMVTLSPVNGLTDACPGGLANDLAPGAMASATGTYTLTQADIDAGQKINTATATATDPDENPVLDNNAVTTVLPRQSAISIDKLLQGNSDQDGSGTVTPGDTLTYRFIVTNPGNQTLSNVRVADPLVGLGPILPPSVPSLAPGESVTFSAQYFVTASDLADPDGSIDNTATATGTDPTGGTQSATDSEQVFVDRLGAIRGRVFNDVNGNTVIDSFESGIGVVTVQLYNDLNQNGRRDETDVLVNQVITSNDGSYQFPQMVSRDYILDILNGTVPTGFKITTGTDPLGVNLQPASELFVHFGYQAVIQFVTPLGAYRSDLPDDLVVPFVRPASDPIGDLLRDPDRSMDTMIPWYTPYQSITISNPAETDLRITGLTAVIESANIPTSDFITVYTEGQLNRLAELESVLDGLLAAGQPIPAPLRAELTELLAGVTDPVSQIPVLRPGDSAQLLVIYRPIQIVSTAESITAQLPDWSATAPPEQGRAHTFGRNDRLVVTTSAEQSLEYQLQGGSTYDSDISNHNGFVELDDFALINAIIADRWPTNPGDPSWDPTTDANIRFPNGADGKTGSFWPDVLLTTDPANKEDAFGDFGVLNVEIQRNSRAPYLDLNTGAESRGTDHTAPPVTASDLASGVPIVASDAEFGNAPLLELEKLTIELTNALDGANERFSVITDGTDIVVLEDRFENGKRILVLGTTGIPAIVDSYLQVLKTVRYVNDSSTPTAGIRVIQIQAIGSTGDFSFSKNGVDVRQKDGNIAITRITI